MIGCVPPAGYTKGSDGRTLPPGVAGAGVPSQWTASRDVHKGETLWTENLFVFGGNALGNSFLTLTEDMEWNRTALKIWDAMVLKGGDKVTMWARGFGGLARALLVASQSPETTSIFVEERPVSPESDSIAVSLATLLVRAFERFKNAPSMLPLQAAWLLMALQKNSVPLHSESLQPCAAGLRCFFFFLEKVARVPLKAAANALLSVVSVTNTGEVEMRCVAIKPISAGKKIRLHLGRDFCSCVLVPDDLQATWRDYCCTMEKGLFVAH